MKLGLLAVHRLLIQVFSAFSALFAYLRFDAWRRTGATIDLACGVGSALIAVGGIVYLARARHLRRQKPGS